MGPGSRGACHRARIRATRWLGRDDEESWFHFIISATRPIALRSIKSRIACA
jgi:hypothetical protein